MFYYVPRLTIKPSNIFVKSTGNSVDDLSIYLFNYLSGWTSNLIELTWLSLRPSFSASFFLSGLLMYFCIWNRRSRPLRCRSLNTARRIMPRRGFPRPLCAHGNVPGNGNTVDWVPDTGVDTVAYQNRERVNRFDRGTIVGLLTC